MWSDLMVIAMTDIRLVIIQSVPVIIQSETGSIWCEYTLKTGPIWRHFIYIYAMQSRSLDGWVSASIDIQKMLMLQAVQEMMRIRCQSSGQVAVSQFFLFLVDRQSVINWEDHRQPNTHTQEESFWELSGDHECCTLPDFKLDGETKRSSKIWW